jgi:acetamidase/formamidase
VRFGLESARLPGLIPDTRADPLLERGPYMTTANGPDLFANAQAIRYMIDHLVEERGLSREEAYILCSVAVDLKISEIVDAPNWIVSAACPKPSSRELGSRGTPRRSHAPRRFHLPD